MGMGRGGSAAWIVAVWCGLGLGCSTGFDDPAQGLTANTFGDSGAVATDTDGLGEGDTEGGIEGGTEGEDGQADAEDTADSEGPPEVETVCGDGMVTGPEQCDDGAANGPAASCTSQCTVAYCGDGFVHASEECDDGNNVDSDACRNDCSQASCGDGVVQEGVELCDDGNLNGAGDCTASCTLASCGDGVVQPPEVCDDGNASNADGCLNTCVPASCGDGWVQPPEQCDDGNGSDSDACLSSCEQASCGDGEVYLGVEECDSGGDPTVYSCSQTCQDQQVWYQWTFYQGQLPNPMACADFTSWRAALADDHTSITLAGTGDPTGRTCTGPAATQLCNALRLGVSTTIDCNNHTWHVGSNCVGTMEVTVDGSNCDCAYPGYALRPCVPYVDWGGVATSTCAGPSQQIYIECGFI